MPTSPSTTHPKEPNFGLKSDMLKYVGKQRFSTFLRGQRDPKVSPLSSLSGPKRTWNCSKGSKTTVW